MYKLPLAFGAVFLLGVSYGVLEELRRTEVKTRDGTRRMLDEVDLIDRLRATAGRLLRDSPAFQILVREIGAAR